MDNNMLQLRISHWLPIVTFCPVNRLPDFIYITITFRSFEELYAVRKRIRKIAAWRLRFMEDIAQDILYAFPTAYEVEVRLLTGRHVVTIGRV
jgi:hypothetical protein